MSTEVPRPDEAASASGPNVHDTATGDARGPARPGTGDDGTAARELPSTSDALMGALGQVARLLLRRGREEVGKAATQGRARLDVRQLKRDQSRMYEKLGREVRLLVEGGELDHPGLRRGVERIIEHELKLCEAEGEVARLRAHLKGASAEAAEQESVAAGG